MKGMFTKSDYKEILKLKTYNIKPTIYLEQHSSIKNIIDLLSNGVLANVKSYVSTRDNMCKELLKNNRPPTKISC